LARIEQICSTTGRWLDRLRARPKALLLLAFALGYFPPACRGFPWRGTLKPVHAATRMRLGAVKFS